MRMWLRVEALEVAVLWREGKPLVLHNHTELLSIGNVPDVA